MACRGVHFSLTEEQVDKLRSFGDDSDRLDYLLEELEEHYFTKEPRRKAETDKAWYAIHRALTDGDLGDEDGTYPLNHVILGGEALYAEDDFIMSLKTPQQVKHIAAELPSISKELFRVNYFRIDPDEYGMPLSENDFEYSWEWFSELKDFYHLAAEEGRYVLFTVDQ